MHFGSIPRKGVSDRVVEISEKAVRKEGKLRQFTSSAGLHTKDITIDHLEATLSDTTLEMTCRQGTICGGT